MTHRKSGTSGNIQKPTTEPLTQLYLLLAAISLGIGIDRLLAVSQPAVETIRFLVLFIVVTEWLHSQIAFGDTDIDTVASRSWQLMAVEFYIDIAVYVMPVVAAFNLRTGNVFYAFIALVYGLDTIVEYLALRRLDKSSRLNRDREILKNWIRLDLIAFPTIIVTAVVFGAGSVSHKVMGDIIVLVIVFVNMYVNYTLNRDFYFGVPIQPKAQREHEK